MENTFTKIRAGGICVLDNKVLLIHRINLDKEIGSQEYYVIPGGGLESHESVEEAVVREMKEETDLAVQVGELFFEMEDKAPSGDNRKHYYYLCEYVSGEARLREDSEEAKEMKEGIHFYKPTWVPVEDLTKIIIFPEMAKEALLDYLLPK